MKLKSIVTASLMGLLLAGGPVAAAESSAQGQFAALAQSAKQALDKAGSVNGEWRDSRKILKKAQAAAKSGDYDKAMSLAKKAKSQGELGYKQAVNQKAVTAKLIR